jgi:hypothetical protein
MHDPAVASAIIAAMARRETGREIAPGIVAQGVSQALGAPVAVAPAAAAGAPVVINPPVAAGAPISMAQQGAAGAAGPNGKAELTIRHINPPPGTTVSASTSGDVFTGAPQISQAMRDF